MIKIVLYIFGGLVFLAVLALGAIVAFGWWWDVSSGQKFGDAIERLKTHTSEQHKVILNECSKLMVSYSKGEEQFEVVLNDQEIPESLTFTSPTFVRYDERSCMVLLYKVPGKGVGYSVSFDEQNEPHLSWFNDFESWERHDIDL